jgi:hypothetical protein
MYVVVALASYSLSSMPVFRLPLLGSILFSGQEYCRDSVRRPLPHSEGWTAVTRWMHISAVVSLLGLSRHEQNKTARDCIELFGKAALSALSFGRTNRVIFISKSFVRSRFQ